MSRRSDNEVRHRARDHDHAGHHRATHYRIRDIAALMLHSEVSGLPVVDNEMHLLGLVTEDDLLRREEAPLAQRSVLSERARPLWLQRLLEQYQAAEAATAQQLMTAYVETADEDTPARDLARHAQPANRVLILRNGRLVGIVTRADVLKVFVRSDQALVDAVRDTLRHDLDLDPTLLTITCKNGIVTLAGEVARHRSARSRSSGCARSTGSSASTTCSRTASTTWPSGRSSACCTVRSHDREPEERHPPGAKSSGMTAAASPYPSARETDVVLRDGSTVHVRPIRPDDEARLLQAAPRPLRRGAPAVLRMPPPDSALAAYAARAVVVDYVRRFGLIAIAGAAERIVGHGCYDASADGQAEVAFTVADEYQGRGLVPSCALAICGRSPRSTASGCSKRSSCRTTVRWPTCSPAPASRCTASSRGMSCGSRFRRR